MNRRRFLQHIYNACTAYFIGLTKIFAQKSPSPPISMSIVYSGNLFGKIEPIQSTTDKKHGMGGLVTQAKIIQQIKQESDHCILLDTGNLWLPNPPLSSVIGQTIIEAMNVMGYSACGLGQQEMNALASDNAAIFANAQFPMLSCNALVQIPTSLITIQAYTIVQCATIKVGIIGLNASGTEAQKDAQKAATNLIAHCDKIATQLKGKEKCQLVICISQLAHDPKEHPFENNYQLAKSSSNIDLIIGGNSRQHTVKPLKLTNKKKKLVLLTQLGLETVHLGRIDYTFFSKKTFFTTNAQTVELLK
jgi:5'-nucleotidase